MFVVPVTPSSASGRNEHAGEMSARHDNCLPIEVGPYLTPLPLQKSVH